MRRWRSAAVVVLAAVLLTGCTGASDSQSDEAPPSQGMPTEEFGGDGGMTDGGVSGGGTGGAAPDSADRDVIVQGYLTLTAADPIEAADDAVRIVERAGGRVDSRSERPAADDSGDGASAQLVVRIPSDRLTAALEDITALGEVEDLSINSTDVTAQTQDLDARISALQASVDRLLELLTTATSTTDLIAIESALSERQANLESLEAERRYLSEQVDLSTITVDIGSVETAPIDEPEGFLDGLLAGWTALVGFLGASLIAFGVALPWLVTLAVLALVVLLIVRAVRRSRRARNAAPTETAATAEDRADAETSD